MKYIRKCVTCNKKASKRLGKLDFCDSCHKKVRRSKAKYVWKEIYVFTLAPGCRIYTDVPVKVY